MKKKIIIILMFLLLIPIVSVYAGKNDNSTNEASTAELKENNSIFLAGDDVSTTKDIAGILFMAGNVLNSNNYIEYGMLAGNDIFISGEIEKDLFVAGNVIKIDKTASIGRDVYIAGSNVTIDTDVPGNVYIYGDKINLNGDIAGDVYLGANTINFGDDIKIAGKIKYNDDATVNNFKEDNVGSYETYEIDDEESWLDILKSKLIYCLTLIVTGGIIHLLFKKLYNKIPKDIEGMKLLKKLFVGFVFLIIVPIISVLLFISSVGLPLGIIALLIYGIMIYLSQIVSSTVIGHNVLTKLCKEKENPLLSIIIGSVLFVLLTSIPYVGTALFMVFMLIGLGLFVEIVRR